MPCVAAAEMSLRARGGPGIPIKLLREAETHNVTVELKGGEVYRGTLDSSEESMNVQLAAPLLAGAPEAAQRLDGRDGEVVIRVGEATFGRRYELGVAGFEVEALGTAATPSAANDVSPHRCPLMPYHELSCLWAWLSDACDSASAAAPAAAACRRCAGHR